MSAHACFASGLQRPIEEQHWFVERMLDFCIKKNCVAALAREGTIGENGYDMYQESSTHSSQNLRRRSVIQPSSCENHVLHVRLFRERNCYGSAGTAFVIGLLSSILGFPSGIIR